MTAIAYEYEDEIKAVQDGIGVFIRNVVIPLHEKNAHIFENDHLKYRPDGSYSDELLALMREVRMKSAEAGYYTMCVPEHMGGAGLGYVAYFAAWEKIFHTCGAKYFLASSIVSHWARGPSLVLEHLSSRLKSEILPDIQSGNKTICFALSEPGAGSDASQIKTSARPDNNGWRINGEKIWVTNSPYADYAIVFAVTDPDLAVQRKGGITGFVVPTDAEGFKVERLIKMFGQSHTDEALLHFDNVYVDGDQVLGEVGFGFKTAMLGSGLGRIYNVARCVGMGRWALEIAFDYIKVRKTFGKALAERQGVTFPLVESATQIHAAHLMSLNVAQLLDKGHRAAKELAMVKAYCGEVGPRAVDRVIQFHGAMGFTNEMQLFEAYISMRKIAMADGSIEIMRHLVSRKMLDGDMEL